MQDKEQKSERKAKHDKTSIHEAQLTGFQNERDQGGRKVTKEIHQENFPTVKNMKWTSSPIPHVKTHWWDLETVS